jgi:hypothetical protein
MLRMLEVNVDDHLYGGVYVLVKNIIANLPSDITADIAALEPFDDEKHISYGTKVYYVGSNRNKIHKQLGCVSCGKVSAFPMKKKSD